MIPEFVRVLGLDLPVLLKSRDDDPALDGRHAYYDPPRDRIVLHSGDSEESLKETLLHELLHALEKATATALEEEQVCRFGRGLFAVLRDNPALVRWWMDGAL